MADQHQVDLVGVQQIFHGGAKVGRYNVVCILKQLRCVLRIEVYDERVRRMLYATTDHHAVTSENHPRCLGAIDILQIVFDPATRSID